MSSGAEKIKFYLVKTLKWFIGSSGILVIIFFLLSFTDIPYYAYHYLGTCNSKVYYKPKLIVLLGGAGMPSPDGFMRTYYTTLAANKFKDAKIIIALPKNEGDSIDQPRLMANELILHGIDSSRISFEPTGFNTRSQAENIATGFAAKFSSILLVTSPEHMYRSVETFKRSGFKTVSGMATFEKPPDEEKIEDTENSSDTRVKSPDLRYNTWSYMHYELLVMKEYCAITYYWMKGWI